MAIRGVTFSKQSVSSNDDSHIYKVLLNGKQGITKGCKLTRSADDIFISEGYFFAASRLINISASETVTTPVVTSGTLYCRLVFEIDLSKSNTNNNFNQGSFKIITSETSYPEVIQENLEDGGNVYQLPFARFAKTIEGISGFVSEKKYIGTLENTETIYVATNGSNESGDGSESMPFKTIQHAIDSLPKNLNDRAVIINIASGTYSENVNVTGFFGGTLQFTFGTCTIKSFTVHEANVIMAGTELTLSASGNTYGILCRRGANVISQLPITINGSTNGVYVAYGGRFAGRNPITINSCTYAATVAFAAIAYFSALDGSRNNNGVQATGGTAHIGTIASAMAGTLYITSAGGRIYTGAQASVPSY